MKERSSIGNSEDRRLGRLFERQTEDELRLMPGRRSTKQLWDAVKVFAEDYEPWGSTVRTEGDCSCGCVFYHELAGRAGADFGICSHPRSHRAGLLTWEHQGCPLFQNDPRWDYLSTANGRKARERFEDREEELRQWKKVSSIQRVIDPKSK